MKSRPKVWAVSQSLRLWSKALLSSPANQTRHGLTLIAIPHMTGKVRTNPESHVLRVRPDKHGEGTVDANENLTANDELNLVKALQTSCQS